MASPGVDETDLVQGRRQCELFSASEACLHLAETYRVTEAHSNPEATWPWTSQNMDQCWLALLACWGQGLEAALLFVPGVIAEGPPKVRVVLIYPTRLGGERICRGFRLIIVASACASSSTAPTLFLPLSCHRTFCTHPTCIVPSQDRSLHASYLMDRFAYIGVIKHTFYLP